MMSLDAPRGNVSIEHQEVTPSQAKYKSMGEWQKHSAVDILQVKPPKRKLLARPCSTSRVQTFPATSSSSHSVALMELLILLPPQLAVLLAPCYKSGVAGISCVRVPGGTEYLKSRMGV